MSTPPQIPQPCRRDWGPYRTLLHVPELDHQDCIAMKKELPSCIRRYLDERISWPQQDEERINAFLREMVVRFPCLERYEHAWPLKPFTAEWLAQRKRRGSRALGRRMTTRSTNADRNASTPDRPSAPSPAPSSRVEIRKQHAPEEPVQRTRQLVAEHTTQPASPSREPERQASTCTTEVSVTVRRFLASLCPSMKELSAVFGLVGVRDRASLAALVAMTDAQQRAFLERLPLSLFQREVVHNGLATRRRQAL